MNTRRVTVGVVVQYIVLTLVFILLAGPLVWELSLAVKGPNDNVYSLPPYLFSEGFHAEQFRRGVQASAIAPVFRQYADCRGR